MTALAQLVVAALVTVAIGLLDGQGWPSYVMGAVLALALWVMLFAGSLATPTRGLVAARSYGLAALLGLALGYLMARIADGGAWWAVGFIMAGVLVPATAAAARDRDGRTEDRSG